MGKRKGLTLLFCILLFYSSFQFTTGAQSLSQVTISSRGSIALYSTLRIRQYTINSYGIFDTTPQAYSELYDMTQADYSANVRTNIFQVKQIRPDFKALVYRNMRCVETNFQYYTTFVNNGWLLKDEEGNYIPTDVPNSYLVDIGNSDYQNWIGSYLNTQINDLGYDGVFADNSLYWGYYWVTSQPAPINPRTNQLYTYEESRQSQISLHNTIKNYIGDKLLVCNGVYRGEHFYQKQASFEEVFAGSNMDGFMSEGAWNFEWNAQWYTEQQWLQQVNFLLWVQDNFLLGYPNRFYVPVAKLAYGNQNPVVLPPNCSREQMTVYGFTSILLAAQVEYASQIYFSTFSDSSFISQMQPLFQVDIGTPNNDYFMISGTHLYTRDFSNGKVLVNPTGQLYSTSFLQNYKTLDGQIVSSINVSPHSGVILLSI